MSLDPDLPTKDRDLEHLPELGIGCAAVIVLIVLGCTIGWTSTLATLIAAFLLYIRDTWTPR